MWFGLPAEIAVRCEHCGENDWRTPVELKSGCLVCFMCAGVSVLAPPVAEPVVTPAVGSNARETAASALGEIARRLAGFQPLARAAPREVGRRVCSALPRTGLKPSTR